MAKKNQTVQGKTLSGLLFMLLLFSVGQSHILAQQTERKRSQLIREGAEKATFLLTEERVDEAQLILEKTMASLADRIYADSLFWKEDMQQACGMLNNLGIIYRGKGYLDRAADCYLQAVDIAEKHFAGDMQKMIRPLINLGTILVDLGDFDKAWRYYSKARDLADETAFFGSPIIYRNMAVILRDRAEYSSALAYLKKAIAYNLNSENPRAVWTAVIYGTTASVYEKMAKPDSAHIFYLKELAIYENVPDAKPFYLFLAHKGLGRVAFSQKKYKQAIDYTQQASQIILKAYGEPNQNLAESKRLNAIYLAEMGRYEEAEDMFEQALAANHKENTSPLAKTFSQSLDNYVQLELLGNYGHFLSNKPYTNPQRQQRADSLIRAATDLSDHLRSTFQGEGSKLELQQKSIRIFEDGLILSGDLLKDKERAFFYAEKSKAAILGEALRETQARSFSGIPTEVLEKEKRLRTDLAYYEKKLFEEQQKAGNADSSKFRIWRKKTFTLHQEYDKLLSVFEEKYPSYHRLKYNSKMVTVAELQAAIPDNTALLEYFCGERRSCVFLIQKDTFLCQELPLLRSGEIDSFRLGITGFYQSNTASRKRESWYDSLYRHYAYELYQKCLQPLAKQLPERLIIIPDGQLAYVPFETLLSKKTPESPLPSSYPYLLKSHSISYAFSANLLLLQFQQSTGQRAKNKLLAIAPSFGETGQKQVFSHLRDEHFAALKHNQEEVHNILTSIAGKASLGADANKKNFLEDAPNYRFIHIASHVQLNEENHRYSFVAFSQDEDNRLYLSELYNLEFPAEMVVLSACNTATGKLHRGEGIASLARGFTYAGAHSLVTTLWSVNDHYTAELMSLFYSKLKSGLSKDQALREAKLELLVKKHLPPYYWSAAIAMGDMKPIKMKEERDWEWWALLGIVLLGFGLFWKKKRQARRA